ncbi:MULTISPECIES: hypothetical protein [Curtobacterium]|uniref:hypothetical protein n=1 Tax=Curtobacterium TaxID=2034 RepID=UPI000A667ABA|nr:MULTISPECIES: hypothetical protein [Curtobacterium]UBQ02654.1 hypothetical protein LCG91_00305 [Curtobacterium sp. TXMA1]
MNAALLDQLRGDPTEWHRRGMSAPGDIDRIVADRLGTRYTTSVRVTEPSYADFFVAA